MLIEVFLQFFIYLFAFLVLFYIDQSSDDQTKTDLGASTVTVIFSTFFFNYEKLSKLGTEHSRLTVL